MTTRIRGLAWALCACALAVPTTLGAQTPTTGVVAGIVVDDAGAPLRDVQVSVSPTGGGAVRRTIAGRDGSFDVLMLPPGDYDVLVERLAYQPVRVRAVPVRSHRTVRLTVVLLPTTGPVTAPEERTFAGITGGALPGVSEVFDDNALAMLQDRWRAAGELARLSSRASLDLAVEGLPSSFTQVTLDGMPFRTAGLEGIADPALYAFAVPLGSVRQAELFGGVMHAQTPSLAGGLMSITTRPGGEAGGRALGSIVPLGDNTLPDGHQELRGAFDAGTTLLNDSAHVRVFGSIVRSSTDLDRWRTPGDEAALAALQTTIGGDSVSAGGRFTGDRDRLHVGGRFDWLFGEDQTVALTALYASASGSVLGAADGAVRPDEHDASDLAVVGAWNARFSESVGASVQIGFTRSSREFGDVARLDAGSGVLISEGRVAIGGDASLPATADRTDVHTHAGLLLRSDAHLFQVGVGAAFATHEVEYAPARLGLFTFGSAADLEALTGTFVQSTGAAPVADFTSQQLYAYMQDRWAVAPGLDLLTGGRVAFDMLPTSDIVPATEWAGYTGLDNTAAPERLFVFGASAGFEWDVQQQHRWLVRGDFGVQSGEIAPEVLAEALALDGRPTIERYAGDLGAFPDAPATQSARRLTLLDSELEAPFTTRGSIGISAGIADHTALLLGAAMRRTNSMIRRTDVNLITLPTAEDQHGRPVYGSLVQTGALVTAEPGTSRRFSDYDVVSVLTSDATSTYWGVNVGIERRAGGLLDVLASYTYSQTTDELYRRGDALLPGIAPDVGVSDWADGTSDFDVPHRAAVAVRSRIPSLDRVRAGATLRYESGEPFTAGFGPGIDANADGIAGNDPAFVDPFVEGMDPLLAEWDCLRSSANRFVERNSCRAPARRALDVRLEADVVARPDFDVTVQLEALDLLAEGGGWYDTALYTIDAETPADLDPADGIVSVPLRVNENFGQTLVDAFNPTRVRLGLQLRF